MVKNLIWIGLVEDMGNIASHTDVPVSPQQVRSRLGPNLKNGWDLLDVFWREVAPQKPLLDPEGKALTIEQYESLGEMSRGDFAGTNRTAESPSEN